MKSRQFTAQLPPLTEKEADSLMALSSDYDKYMTKTIHDRSMELFFAERELSEIEIEGGMDADIAELQRLQALPCPPSKENINHMVNSMIDPGIRTLELLNQIKEISLCW